MPNLRAQASMHARQGQTPEVLGARERARQDASQLDQMPEAMTIRRQTVEHPFGTLKAWMGSTHFLTRTLEKVKTEMSLQVLAYNMKRMINILRRQPADAGDRGLTARACRRQASPDHRSRGHQYRQRSRPARRWRSRAIADFW
jgi:hypothetical protein